MHTNTFIKYHLSSCFTCCRDKELAAVKVSPADVDIISIEFEVTKKQADLRLREHKGDVRAALESYL